MRRLTSAFFALVLAVTGAIAQQGGGGLIAPSGGCGSSGAINQNGGLIAPSGCGGGNVATVRAITNRNMIPNVFATAPANTGALANTSHLLMDNAFGQIEIWWPNWYTAANVGAPFGGVSEVAPGIAATGTAQITYTDAGTGNPVTVNLVDKIGGTTALTAPDGGFFKAVATINAAKGTRVQPRLRASFPNGIPYAQQRADLANGDRFQFGTFGSLPSLTTTPTQTFALFWYGPCLILATSNLPVAGIVGDSIDAGIYDNPSTAPGDVGTFARLFGANNVAYADVSSPGERAATFAGNTNNANRLAILAAANITAVAVGTGINDIYQPRTAVQTEAANLSIVNFQGKPGIIRSLSPRTIGGKTTPTNSTNETQRLAYNTWAQTQSINYGFAAALESVGTPGAWNSWSSLYPDYLHTTNLANAYAVTSAAIVGATVGVFGVAAQAAGPVMPDGNLFTAPTDLSNAAWAKTAVTVGNAGAANQNFKETATTNNHNLGQVLSKGAAATKYRLVADIVPNLGRDWVQLAAYNASFGAGAIMNYNATTATLGTPTPFGGFVNVQTFFVALEGGGNAVALDFTTDTNTTVQGYVAAETGDTVSNYPGDITKGLTVQNTRIYVVP